MNHIVKITAIETDHLVGTDPVSGKSYRISFKSASRTSGVKEYFTFAQLQPLLDFLGLENVSDLKNYTFGISPTTREYDGFLAQIERARAAMTPIESLLTRASATFGKLNDTDFTDPRNVRRALGELFGEDGLLSPVGNLLKEAFDKPQPPTKGTPSA